MTFSIDKLVAKITELKLSIMDTNNIIVIGEIEPTPVNGVDFTHENKDYFATVFGSVFKITKERDIIYPTPKEVIVLQRQIFN